MNSVIPIEDPHSLKARSSPVVQELFYQVGIFKSKIVHMSVNLKDSGMHSKLQILTQH